jgi:DNA-binding XRE family transcriptional regulator
MATAKSAGTIGTQERTNIEFNLRRWFLPIEILTVPRPLKPGLKARLLRIANGMRQTDVADRAEVAPSVVSAYERGLPVSIANRILLNRVYERLHMVYGW